MVLVYLVWGIIVRGLRGYRIIVLHVDKSENTKHLPCFVSFVIEIRRV